MGEISTYLVPLFVTQRLKLIISLFSLFLDWFLLEEQLLKISQLECNQVNVMLHRIIKVFFEIWAIPVPFSFIFVFLMQFRYN